MSENIVSSFEFFNEIINWESKQDSKKIDFFLNSLLPEFIEKYKYEKEKLPYHINLLDEIHANENAHSRILMKLLNAENGKDYFLLKSFLKFLNKPFSDLEIINPNFESERDRIDVRIRAKDFSLIIENKIHYAVDQEEQIITYVEKEENYERRYNRLKNIYILYLCRDEKKDPSISSLPEELKNDLGEKYKAISYAHHILPWLESLNLNEFNQKENLLSSAITQYIDHLKGMLHLRKIEEKMNKELRKYLIETLKLEGLNASEQYEIIESKEIELRRVLDFLTEIKEEQEIEVIKELFNILFDKLKKDFSKYKPAIYFRPDGKCIHCSITLKSSNINPFMISFETDFKSVFYGIYTKNQSKEDKKSLKRIISANKFEQSEPIEDEWPWWNYSTNDEIYDDFKGLCNKMIKIINSFD